MRCGRGGFQIQILRCRLSQFPFFPWQTNKSQFRLLIQTFRVVYLDLMQKQLDVTIDCCRQAQW